MQEKDHEYGVGLGYYWDVIKRQRWIVALGAILGICGAVVAYNVMAPSYAATTQVQISPLGEDPVALSQNPANLIDHTFEVALVTSDQSLAVAVEELGFATAGDVRQSVSASLAKESSVISITFSGKSPKIASQGASAVAKSYLAEREQLIVATVENRLKALDAELATLGNSEDSKGQRTTLYGQRLEILAVDTNAGHVLNAADTHTIVRTPNLRILGVSGAALGLVLGMLVGVIRDRRNPRFQNTGDLVRVADAPVLGAFGTVELSLPLAPDAMVQMSIVRERILANNERGTLVVVGSGSLLADPMTTALTHTVKVPVEFSIALAISMSQAVSGVRLAIAGCDARELIRITRHLSLYQDPQDPDLLRTHHAPDLSVVTFTYNEELHGATVFTREVVKELESDATHTIVALGSSASPTSWTSGVRQADYGVVVVDPNRSEKEELARTTEMMANLRTRCTGMVTVEEFVLVKTPAVPQSS